ncbi:threonine/serine exporter family protein [Propionicimonas sp. T2.31MG-18]|uniref:threonine/serine exporter family protein n=1 Tax=Propionicimonas sp. T2.31MG-18 TaxID=3157620 RepID=UPI00366B023E
MPKAQLLPAVAIRAGGWVVASLGSQLGTVSGWFAYAVVAACVGAVGALTARLRDSATSVYTGVAILPLVPGFTLCQGMLALADRQTAAGVATLGPRPSPPSPSRSASPQDSPSPPTCSRSGSGCLFAGSRDQTVSGAGRRARSHRRAPSVASTSWAQFLRAATPDA